VLPAAVTARVSVEHHVLGGSNGPQLVALIGIDRFGASAPGDELMQEFGFTVDNVYETAKLVQK
jgi:transketolase